MTNANDTRGRLPRNALTALFALHAAVATALIVWNHPWSTGDTGRYLALADSLANGHGYGLGNGPAFVPEGWRLPGYPLFISLIGSALRSGVAGVVAAQGLLYLASVWLAWRFTEDVFGRRVGSVFLALSAVYVFVPYYCGLASAEILSLFLVNLAFYCLTRATPLRYVLVGLVIGLSGYVRPNLLPISVVVALAVALVGRDRRALGQATTVVFVAGLVILPWAVRNHIAFGVFTPGPVFKGTGTSLLLATWQSRLSVHSMMEFGMRGRVDAELAESGLMDQLRALNREIGVPADTVFVTLESYPDNESKFRAERLLTAAAFRNIRERPWAYLRSTAVNTMRLWMTAYFPERIPTPLRIAFLLEGGLALALGIAGVALAVREVRDSRRGAVVAAALTLVFFSLGLCWLHTEARFTIPARLLLLAFASYALTSLPKALRGQPRPGAGASSAGTADWCGPTASRAGSTSCSPRGPWRGVTSGPRRCDNL
ncbi:MAG: glycosyltransferase family 39 protein [Isosphaeraceae bacterium]|jgi:hypothetical protein